MTRGTLDGFICRLDRGLRAITDVNISAQRPYPARTEAEEPNFDDSQYESSALMRVNHAGEVAAQALYHGQAVTAQDPQVQAALEKAAAEEGDHLAWCRTRLSELNAHPSRLNFIWYAGSFLIGATAGLLGDKWSLGFLAETEHQVVAHLDRHLQRLPEKDTRSRAIIKQMREDEHRHATAALTAGGAPLPNVVKGMMRATSGIMTRTAYRW